MIYFIRVLIHSLSHWYAKQRERYEESIFEKASVQDVLKEFTEPVLRSHLYVVSSERGEKESNRETLGIKRENFEKAIKAYCEETEQLEPIDKSIGPSVQSMDSTQEVKKRVRNMRNVRSGKRNCRDAGRTLQRKSTQKHKVG